HWLLADRGYDADWFRKALQGKGIRACIPGRKARKLSVKYDKRRYKRRNRLLTHVNMRCQVRDRDHVRQAQGLATRGNPLRQMPKGLPLRHRVGRYRAVLVMSPEPSWHAIDRNHALTLNTQVNGELRQDAVVRDLFFDIPTIIETISAAI